ncbi:HpcH/HpaI aldolase family protein [Variovorax sp. PBL-E5]|uniref:HpcH/HpaI aldolase family protein n=1 Tax=Variovorax sp. PBL-E5 TaxID=434014 RepID=UPI0013163553|nr:aldolase/citrate lyase family protein [Variovorax sp. PBL-E5]VTU17436.1 4-hydroxy-2-oxo-heptane-1,7-dioate aldolase [Variovorax sp. PBL-E5]
MLAANPMPSKNKFKAALAARRPQYGLVLGTGDPSVLEIIAGAGFDWLLLDGEHSAREMAALPQQLALIAASGASAALRPGSLDKAACGLCLDIGVQTLVAPLVESVSQAHGLVASTRFPPAGTRGVGTALARAAGWGRDADFLRGSAAELCIVAQIESAAGVHCAGEIARVDGIDALLIGPSDLAASLGHLGQPSHPEVEAQIAEAVAAALSGGKAAGIFVRDPDAAARYLRLGCSFFIVGVDMAVMAGAFDALRAGYAARPD